ncbi:IgGFc-binding protein-like [Dicentrarchus labrax]|uniref:IgGFc-binding protein-like n=1 Tax=Dicentrarchus labrax TaxID=13489 RepID=UPI0021F63640|nr:IgGFc-binding protein-like [Dicentrarchus labrax]
MVTTPDEFGTAWKVAGSDTCSDGCGSSCQQCTNELHARAQCEVIQAADGPLRFCHEHVDPARYFKSCVFDVCVLGDDFLCGAIQTYVSACQSANGRIYPWRQNTTCRPECPANSHYELCGSDCGHTCASSMNASCGQVCSEGCFCDEGFVRSGTGCVPVESCGCEHDGSYYKDGESFWTEGCSQQCECHAPNDLRCSAASCTPAQECAIRDGRLGCFLYDLTTCTVWGDPHYITFDHKAYDFQGTCRYVVATLCNDTDGLHPFSVEAKNERWSRRPECPANSHYELCGSDCGHTCASSMNASCGQVCSEGCFCDEGFVRSGTGCVPVESCGCEHDGSYYKDGESFWTEGCSQQCECHAPNDLHCSAASCTPAQECAIRDGRLGCFLYDLTTCTVWGDPHYITFDHKAYDFQGTCRYVVATLCNDTDGLHPFSVEAKNERWSRSTVSVIAEVFVNVLGNQVHMSRGRNGVVKVNGVTKNVPVFLNGSDVSVYASGSFIYISANFGLIVKYNGLYELTISVPSSYRGKTCGLCGNFNGNPDDEFRIPSGMMVTTPDEFGTAWKVAGSDTCSDGCGSSCQQCTNELHARAQCEVIQAADGPLRFCHEHVDPARYFKSCVFDVCVLGDDFLCGAIQTYVSACQSANGRIYPWRQNTTCRPECPANSHYELCGSDCGHTCASSINASCGQVCSEGCFCDEGFVRSGTGCVPVESCGCEHDGSYYKDGESFWTEGCSQRCECHAPNDLRCSAASCTPAQECAIRDGRLGCFLYDLTTCTVWGDPHYITFDHKAYDFQGTCRYVVATLCNDTDGLHPFSVEAKNERWSRSTVSVIAEVFVNVLGNQVHMSRGRNGVVKVSKKTF